MTNKYFGKCGRCGGKVRPGDGSVRKIDDKWTTFHDDCLAAVDADALDAYRDSLMDDDDRAYVAYDAHVAAIRKAAVMAAWRDGVRGPTAMNAWSNDTPVTVTLPDGITASDFWSVLHAADWGPGSGARNLWAVGGYSIVASHWDDHGDGTATFTDSYRIGD